LCKRNWMHLLAFNFARAVVDDKFSVRCLILFALLRANSR